MLISIPKVYSQRDSSWANSWLGFNNSSPYTIGNYGCLITCISMMCCYYNHEETPLTINKKLIDQNAFSSGGLYVWNSISNIYSDIIESLHITPYSLLDQEIYSIQSSIKNGHLVVFQIDMAPETSQLDMHYVLAIGYDENDENNFTIADPWTGTIISMREYLKGSRDNIRKSIEQYIIYKSDNNMTNQNDQENQNDIKNVANNKQTESLDLLCKKAGYFPLTEQDKQDVASMRMLRQFKSSWKDAKSIMDDYNNLYSKSPFENIIDALKTKE